MAVGAVLMAGLLRQALVAYWGPTFVPYIFYFVAVTFAAWHGRLGPGIVAVLLGAVATAASLARADPDILSHPPVVVSLVVYLGAGLGITIALESMHRARDRAAEAEAAMKAARDDALAANRTKDAFLAMLSHELRTPLNPALLVASESAADPSLPAAARARFDTIARQISIEARLIDDLLDLNRLTLGTLAIDAESIDLHAVIRDASDTVLPEVTAKQMRLLLALNAVPSRIKGDPLRLRQVFWNLLKNAVKFSPARSAIRMESRIVDEWIEVRISDTGIGMKAAELDRVFDPFMQGEDVVARSHEYGGMGLGLAISKSVVSRHGGTIRAESPGPGQGSSFVVSFPLLAASEPVAPEPVTSIPAVEPAVAGCRLLLVEDHEETRRALAKLLERRGHQVTTAGSFTEAVERGSETQFDLVVSDFGLPDRHGAQLLGELRRRQPGLRGIAVSGYGMEGDRERSRGGGYSQHLVKPITFSVLEAGIREALATPVSDPPADKKPAARASRGQI